VSDNASRARLPRVGGHPPLEGVLFDAGLTLIHERTPAREVAAEVLERLGIPFEPAALEQAMAMAMADIASRWHRGDWWVAEASVRRLFTAGYDQGLAPLPALAAEPTLRARAAASIYDAYVDARHWRAFDDVLPALRALGAADVPMAVVSDWGHGLEAILLELELGQAFAFVLVSARIGIGKPDPAVFNLALARLGARAERTVYIGDTYVKDVFGARAAGIVPILLDRRGDLPAMDCVVVRDLVDAVDRLGAKTTRPPATPRTPAAAPPVVHTRPATTVVVPGRPFIPTSSLPHPPRTP